MNDIERESAIAAPLHLVPSREEPAQTFKDVLVDATVCLAPRAVAKVVGPASQRPVQLVTYFRPWIDIARHQKIADPCFDQRPHLVQSKPDRHFLAVDRVVLGKGRKSNCGIFSYFLPDAQV